MLSTNIIKISPYGRNDPAPKSASWIIITRGYLGAGWVSGFLRNRHHS